MGHNNQKYMPSFLLLILYTIFSLAILTGQTNIHLSLEKTVFLLDEPIWIEAEEKNTGDDIVYSSLFVPNATSYCKFILKDGNGNEFPYKGLRGYIPYKSNWKGYKLGPGENRFLVKEILGMFGEKDENHRFVFELTPGHYSLQVLLHTNYHWVANKKRLIGKIGSEANNMLGKRTVYSNIVEFDIVEPTDEEKIVHEKLLKAYKLTWQIKQGSHVQYDIFPILKSILDEHPESVYISAAHLSLRGSVSQKVGYKMDLNKDLIQFKDSFYCQRIIGPIKNEKALERLPGLKAKYPGSQLAKYIDHEFKYGRLKEQR